MAERPSIVDRLPTLLAKRILVLDGAMGTMVQRHKLTESDFRGDRFTDHPRDLRGNNDVLVLTRPDVIAGIHHAYLDAGSDIIETNTFSGTSIAQADYALEPFVYELNAAGARLARRVADEWTARTPDQPRFVAGSMGPTNRILSLSPDVNNPAFRALTFDQLRDYCAHVAGAVGVACIGVYGADQPQRAEALGIALQLINIMRDVQEDWRLGRVYLPQDELASFGVAEEDIADARLTPAWQALMAYQAARARSYLGEGLTLLDYLDTRSSACVGTFAGLYRATLERIEASGFDVFDGPPQLSLLTKLRIVGSSFLA